MAVVSINHQQMEARDVVRGGMTYLTFCLMTRNSIDWLTQRTARSCGHHGQVCT